MARRPVYTNIMSVVERRIAAGDYILSSIPGERKLAEELGVSYLTARKAVLALIEKKVLARKPNGSLIPAPTGVEGQSQPPQVVLLTPAYPSNHFLHCRLIITQTAERVGAKFRPAEYVHWHDPILNDALDGSDGLIIIPSTEPMPPRLIRELARPERKVVVFDDDMTEHGIPSIRLFSRAHITDLYEHLWQLGHRRIDCLNAQGHNAEIDRRIEHWKNWLDIRGGTGRLWDVPAPPYTDPTDLAYRKMLDILSDRPHPLGAIVCTTQPAAVGAMRACFEAGVRVGKDVSLCTINNEPTGRYMCPSLTGLDMPDLTPLIEECFAWFASADHKWSGELQRSPVVSNLLRGESTAAPLSL
jgi:DNA-binding LacI/PurR family transcriptional regulator